MIPKPLTSVNHSPPISLANLGHKDTSPLDPPVPCSALMCDEEAPLATLSVEVELLLDAKDSTDKQRD